MYILFLLCCAVITLTHSGTAYYVPYTTITVEESSITASPTIAQAATASSASSYISEQSASAQANYVSSCTTLASGSRTPCLTRTLYMEEATKSTRCSTTSLANMQMAQIFSSTIFCSSSKRQQCRIPIPRFQTQLSINIKNSIMFQIRPSSHNKLFIHPLRHEKSSFKPPSLLFINTRSLP